MFGVLKSCSRLKFVSLFGSFLFMVKSIGKHAEKTTTHILKFMCSMINMQCEHAQGNRVNVYSALGQNRKSSRGHGNVCFWGASEALHADSPGGIRLTNREKHEIHEALDAVDHQAEAIKSMIAE